MTGRAEPSHSLDLGRAREIFEESTDFTVGLEEEFAIIDPQTLELSHSLRGPLRRVPGATSCSPSRRPAS